MPAMGAPFPTASQAPTHEQPAEAHAILREVFGYESFRGSQQAVIEHVIGGGDALVLMPLAAASRSAYKFRPSRASAPGAA